MKPRRGFVIVCSNVRDGAASEATGPFDTREEARAEDVLQQSEYLTRCDRHHDIVPVAQLGRDVPIYPPRTSVVEREQQMARMAAVRASR